MLRPKPNNGPYLLRNNMPLVRYYLAHDFEGHKSVCPAVQKTFNFSAQCGVFDLKDKSQYFHAHYIKGAHVK